MPNHIISDQIEPIEPYQMPSQRIIWYRTGLHFHVKSNFFLDHISSYNAKSIIVKQITECHINSYKLGSLHIIASNVILGQGFYQSDDIISHYSISKLPRSQHAISHCNFPFYFKVYQITTYYTVSHQYMWLCITSFCNLSDQSTSYCMLLNHTFYITLHHLISIVNIPGAPCHGSHNVGTKWMSHLTLNISLISIA